MTEATHKEQPYTHKAVMTVTSNGDDNAVAVSIKWDPNIDGVGIQELGYLPASYQMIEQYILPALEEAYLEWELDPMMKLDSPSKYDN